MVGTVPSSVFYSAVSKPRHTASRAVQPVEQCDTVMKGAGVGPESSWLCLVLLCNLANYLPLRASVCSSEKYLGVEGTCLLCKVIRGIHLGDICKTFSIVPSIQQELNT